MPPSKQTAALIKIATLYLDLDPKVVKEKLGKRKWKQLCDLYKECQAAVPPQLSLKFTSEHPAPFCTGCGDRTEYISDQLFRCINGNCIEFEVEYATL